MPPAGPDSRPDRLAAGWVAIIPALITLGVTLYRIGVPSFTRDEGATLLAVHRSFPQMIRMLGNVDVVHSEYYALIWAVTRVAGTGELAARAPSAVAMAVAAGGVTLLGQRLVSGRAGLAAGLLLAAFPSVSYYAEDAREYALVTALATVASYLLVRALQAATPETAGARPPIRPRPRDEGDEGTGPQATGGFQGRGVRGRAPGEMECPPGQAGPPDEGMGPQGHRGVPGSRPPGQVPGGFRGGSPPGQAPGRFRDGSPPGQAPGGFRDGLPPPKAGRWLAGYAVALALLGLGNILSLLLIIAHAVTVALWRRRCGGPGQPFVLRWLASVAAAVIVASPVALIASGEAHQVQWIKPPGLVAIIAMAGLIGPPPMFFIVLGAVVLALAAGLVSGRARLRTDWPPGLWGLAVPWLFVPPVLLFGVSVIHAIHPLYVFRYIVFCVPAAALLAGTALGALARGAVGWAVAVAGLIVIAAAGLPAQGSQRIPAGHGYDIRFADRIVARMARPGDALLNVRYWPLAWGGGVEREMDGEYPYGLGRLHDISLARAPAPSATLGGTFARTAVERQRLATVTRLWVASWSKAPDPLPPRLGFSVAYTLHTKGVWLRLYTRPHTAKAAGAAGTAEPGR
jgi:mannosyltransferase